jgi:hypothetical protein
VAVDLPPTFLGLAHLTVPERMVGHRPNDIEKTLVTVSYDQEELLDLPRAWHLLFPKDFVSSMPLSGRTHTRSAAVPS